MPLRNPLCCGCEITPGAPVTPDTLKQHYLHTIQVLLFWELLGRQATPETADKLGLSQARTDLMKAIESLYPEVNE